MDWGNLVPFGWAYKLSWSLSCSYPKVFLKRFEDASLRNGHSLWKLVPKHPQVIDINEGEALPLFFFSNLVAQHVQQVPLLVYFEVKDLAGSLKEVEEVWDDLLEDSRSEALAGVFSIVRPESLVLVEITQATQLAHKRVNDPWLRRLEVQLLDLRMKRVFHMADVKDSSWFVYLDHAGHLFTLRVKWKRSIAWFDKTCKVVVEPPGLHVHVLPGDRPFIKRLKPEHYYLCCGYNADIGREVSFVVFKVTNMLNRILKFLDSYRNHISKISTW